MRAVCVIGLGLIGGSVLRAAASAGATAWGSTASVADVAAARAEGFEVLPLAEAVNQAREADALVVLAVPEPAVAEVLRMVDLSEMRVTDVVSVKGPVADIMQQLSPRARYVGGHPMAGTAHSGWQAGTASLFAGANWVVCVSPESDLEVWHDVASLALSCGARVVPTGVDAHDSAVARISHLPHLLAAVLSSVGADGGALALSLAAGSFADGTRVADTRPELVRAMCEANVKELLPVFDDALGRLGAARGALASTGTVGATVVAGYRARQQLHGEREAMRTTVRVALDAADARTALQRIGERGGRIVALDGRTAIAETA